MAEPRFVHLRVHSDYSMIDGLAKTGPLVKKAASLGMPALAITDFTNLCGLVKFYGTAHGAGMKPVVGADFHVQSDLIGDELTQISVLAMNNTGYQNLTLLISKAYQRGYGALGPWIDRDWLAELNEGLLLISGGRMGDVGKCLLRGNSALVDQCVSFYEEYFPDPKAMIDELHEMGIETMVSIWPQIDWRSENYEEMKQQGLLVKSNAGVDVQMLFHGNNVFLDATNPRTRKYVWEKVKKNYADLGIRTFWLDEAEPEFSTYEYECYRYAAGPVEEIGNIYPREYSRMFYEGQKESGQEDIVNLVRCAWLGSQKYGALVWSGDIFSTYEDFRKQICAGLHMGLCGIPWWTTDIGGFHGGVTEDPDFQELLVRWFQFGTFCPVMRIHGNRGPREEIINKAGEVREGTGADNEVWSFGEKNYEILTKFIGVREKMRDYTRSLMAEAHEKGTPVMRTMFYEFPEDAACWDISDAYMFGSDILVAPIVRPKATSRTVYLPAGASWTLANTGDVYEGGKAYEIEAPIETLPIFLRNGKQGYLVGEI